MVISATGCPRVALLVVDDRVRAGDRPDHGGDRAVAELAPYATVIHRRVVAEEHHQVTEALADALEQDVDIILTVGGTGLRRCSVVPECTGEIVGLRLPGLETQILMKGLESTASAGLCRGIVGIAERGGSRVLVVNSAGSRGAVSDTVAVIGPVLPNILEQLAETSAEVVR